jgi:hypothetical protein
MYDPCTVAHEIKSPFRGKPSGIWPKGYRRSLITIWHVDPEDRRGKCGVRGDDSCGWFSPPYSQAQRDRIHKLGKQEYSTIFGKQHAIAEKRDYARVCYEPSAYDAIYWAWRAIKFSQRTGGWKFGEGLALNAAELQEIFELSSNPVDNLRLTVEGVKNAEDCGDLFLTVYRCYLRFNRPWYKHPRWHFWHWRFQIHDWQALRRWLLTRCASCGKRFTYGYSPVSHSWGSKRPKFLCGEEGLYHSDCSHAVTKLEREPVKGTA